MESKNLIVAIKYAPHTGNFFIDLSNEDGYIVSVKITQGIAENLAKEIGLKITI